MEEQRPEGQPYPLVDAHALAIGISRYLHVQPQAADHLYTRTEHGQPRTMTDPERTVFLAPVLRGS